ncbi:MAG: UDP-N-acetylmuramate dehydrogenase [Candidatus Magasanikbacteria bacterium]|nr:UDP-N-acetylmuramate dehydrogenase [Candidatus Magasanikbacteria bacterium]
MDYVYKQLQKFGKIKTGAGLAKFSSFHIGGPADYFLIVKNKEDLVGALKFISAEGLDYFILGGGSNVLFSDDGFRGVVIQNKCSSLKLENNIITVDGGVELSKVVEAATGAGLAGFEWAAGIPGSVGGAVRGNAGARYAFAGGELKDCAQKVGAWRDGHVTDLSNAACAFGYRDSIFKHEPAVVLDLEIELKPGDKASILTTTQKIIAERRGKQPPQSSAGSFFKNIFLEAWKRDKAELPPRFLEYKKIAAGWLIEQAGLKGYRVGGAMVSQSHANFIINLGQATQADVLAVRDYVMEKVYEKFGISLEEEVMIV